MGINIQGVTFKYQKKSIDNILDDININIKKENEFIAILGHTGSGKSTLVQLMNSLLFPTNGSIRVHDYVITNKGLKYKQQKLKLVRKYVGLVFQFPEYQLFEDTVLKDIMFGPKNFGKTESEAKNEAISSSRLLHIENILERSPFSLSGGQMRRVSIAGILASNPQILILDEPTVGLDPKSKDELMKVLKQIQHNTKKTIIMISHDMNVVAEYASRLIVLKDGKLVYDGEKQTLFNDLDKLHEFNLNLPECAQIALKLKNKGLISFDKFPLTIDELYNVIINQGVQNE